MPTAEEGATAATSHGGEGGAGGKFRRKPFRKPTTPYDRPSIALRGNSLYAKLVDSSSKLISYGARRFFKSVSKKSLPPPPPSQLSESNHVLSDGLPVAVPSDPVGVECVNGVSDLEQLLKQKTFTRSEIDHLTELLHSRGESCRDDQKRNEETASDFESRQRIERCPTEANRSKGDSPRGVLSTPISNAKVVHNSIALPVELAKPYMGCTPSKLSPSVLSKCGKIPGENKLLSNMRIASKPVSVSLTTKTVVGSGSPEDGYLTTPSLLRRSSIYNMSRSPKLKKTAINHYVCAGLPVPSTSLSIVGNNERSESNTKTLKRRSFVLDDEVGSGGPVRRIRQKSNLIGPEALHADRVGSNSNAVFVSSKQKLPLIVDPKRVQRTQGSTDISIPGTIYAIIPYKSNDIDTAVRRSGNLEKIVLEDKSESKKAAAGPNSPFKLTHSMLRGQALKSMEEATLSAFLMNVQDHKFESNVGSLDAPVFPQEHGKVEENDPIETSDPSDTYYPEKKNSAVPLEASLVGNGVSDIIESGPSQPQSRAAFRMSALEDYVDLDDDLPCNGLASRPFSEEREPHEAHFTDRKFSPPEEPKVLESSIQSEWKSPSDLMSSKTNEASIAVAAEMGEGTNGIITPASEEVTAAALPTVPLPPVASFDKPKEMDNPSFPVSSSSKIVDENLSLMPESSSRTPDNSSSLLGVSIPASSLVKFVDPEKCGYLKPLDVKDTSGKCAATELFTDASSNNNTDQISAATPAIFTPSVSVSDYIASGTGNVSSTASSGIVFGAVEAPKVSCEPAFKFGSSPDPSSTASAVSTITPAGDWNNKALTDSSSGIPSSSSTKFVAFGTPSSGNITSGLGSSTKIPSANNSQGSLFSSANKSLVPAVGFVSQGTSAQPFSSASATSQPSSNKNSGTSFNSSLSSSQAFSPVMSFGLNSSASSSDTGAIVSSSGPTSSLFGANPSAISDGSAGVFTSGPKSSLFGVNPSSVSNGSTGASSSGPTSSLFGANPSAVSNGSADASSSGPTSILFGANPSAASNGSAVASSSGPTSSLFGVNPSVSNGNSGGVSSSITTPSMFGFGYSSSSSSINAMGSTGGATASGFSFGVTSGSAPVTTNFFSSSSSSISAGGSIGGATPVFSFGVSSSGSAPVTPCFFSNSSSTSAGAAPIFSFGLSSSASTPVFNAASSFSNGASSVFKFGGSSSASSSAINSVNSNGTPNAFTSSSQAPTSSIFGSSPATGFSFGASATPSVFSSPSPTLAQPVFGNPAPAFAASSPGNNYQMSAEDSMAEDPMQSTAPSVPVFGQANISPSTSSFMFGSSAPSQLNPFQFGGQPNQGVSQNPSIFQASSSVEFNAGGGSFSLGSAGGDKQGRKYVKVNRNKNRKK